MDDISAALGSKNPQVKEGTLKFLNRCLVTANIPPTPAQVKPLSELLASLLDDSFEGARNEAATSLGTLMKMTGERAMNPIMDGMAEVRKVKVKEAYEKAVVKCKIGGGAAPKSAPVAPKKEQNKDSGGPKPPSAPKVMPSPSEVPVVEDITTASSTPKIKRAPPARLLAKKTPGDSPTVDAPKSVAPAPVKKAPIPQNTAAIASSSKATKAGAPAAPSALDTFKFNHSAEEADDLAMDLVPTSIAADLSDANWKTRLAALEEMTSWLETTVETLDAEVLVRFLGKKGWNEKNFQVCLIPSPARQLPNPAHLGF